MTVILAEFILLAVGTIVFIIFHMIISMKIKRLKKLKKINKKRTECMIKPNYDTFIEIAYNQWTMIENKYMINKQLEIIIAIEDEDIFINLLEPNIQKLNDIGYRIKKNHKTGVMKLVYINNKIVS